MVKGESLCVSDLILSGSQDPDAPAIESPGYESLSYHALREQIAYVVKSLNVRGLRPNDRVAVIMPNGPDAAVAILAVMAGFTVVPLNSTCKECEYNSSFSSLGINAVLVQGENTPAVAAAGTFNIPVIEVHNLQAIAGRFTLLPEIDTKITEAIYATPEDIAAIKVTTGTTAKPKFVPVSQKRFFSGMRILNASSHLNNTDKNLHFLPLDTGFGFESPLGGTLLTGGSLVCIRDFIPSDFVNYLNTYRPTYYWGGPAHHQAILRELKKVPRDKLANHSLRLICSGAAAIPPAIPHELEKLLGINFIDVYAMSEAYISMNLPSRQRSVGIPFIRELEIWDDRDHALPPGQTGEIVIRGELVFDGYLNAPEENAEAFTEGWFRTGDMGFLDQDGYLFLTGRKKELINKGGRKIAPVEIDTVLKSHPLVSDAMTFGIADPVLGEDVVAMVVPADENLTETDLRMYLLDRLVQFKVPKRIYFVDEIPKTPTGKPQRYMGTQRYSENPLKIF